MSFTLADTNRDLSKTCAPINHVSGRATSEIPYSFFVAFRSDSKKFMETRMFSRSFPFVLVRTLGKGGRIAAQQANDGIEPTQQSTMFRRFTDRLTNALSGDNNNNSSTGSQQEKMNSLQAMGFSAAQARSALMRNNGNLELAANFLLASGSSSAASSSSSTAAATQQQDAALHNALQESLQSEEQRLYKEAQQLSIKDNNSNKTTTKPHKTSAASKKAGLAAARRVSSKTTSASLSTLNSHHPTVRVPAKLQDKTKEEQVLRCADRLQGHPHAVDTLHKALTTLYQNPNHSKFQTIDTSTAVFQRTLANAPGAVSLLQAMNYVQSGNSKLVLTQADPALLYLGKTALENVQQTSRTYRNEKARIQFHKDMHMLRQSADTSADEAIRRAELLQKCPTEPTTGRGALLQVVLTTDGDSPLVVKRRFDGDDILRDVVHWLGGHGSGIYDRLLSREWCLVDKNRYPPAPLELTPNLDKTLQYIGCWPSGKLQVLPMVLAMNDGEEEDESGSGMKQEKGQSGDKKKSKSHKIGSSRGLGAAPSETL